jgi:hypothetical protein
MALPMKNDRRASMWRIYLAAGTVGVAGYFPAPDK